MKRLLPLLGFTLLLAACVDTTGLSADSHKPVRGNPNAVVVVQEFGDLQCPSCAGAQRDINKPLLEKYPNQIRFEFLHYPLSQHRYSRDLAEAAECAADHQKFWEFVDYAYENQAKLKGKDTIYEWAKELGFSDDLFDRCMRSHIKRAAVNADYAKGQQMNVGGTPWFFINGTQVPARLDAMSAAVEDILKQVKTRL